jgi:hypothetical protein
MLSDLLVGWHVGRQNIRRLLLVKLVYIVPFCAVTADVRVTDSTRAPSVLFAFRNEINRIGVGNISRRAKTLVPCKLPYCRVMLRYGVNNEQVTAQQTLDSKYDPARVDISGHISVSQFTLGLLCHTATQQWGGSRAVCFLFRRTLFRLQAT